MTEQELANIIWNIKEIIRNLYDDSEVEDVNCVLENSYESVLEELNKSAENVSGDFGAKAPRKPMIISE